MTSNTERERSAIEARMDEILAESFPASDPPAWGTTAAQMRHLEAAEDPAALPPRGQDNLVGMKS